MPPASEGPHSSRQRDRPREALRQEQAWPQERGRGLRGSSGVRRPAGEEDRQAPGEADPERCVFQHLPPMS